MHETTLKHTIISHAANVVDKLLTFIGLSRGLVEMNPLLNGLIHTVGLPFALLIAAAIGGVGIFFASKNGGAAYILMLTMLIILFWNVWVLTGTPSVAMIW